MKKLTHILVATIVVLGTTALIANKSKPAAPSCTHTQIPGWFNIEIVKGFTVEFGYGSEFKVYVEGNKDIISKLALVLDNKFLKAATNGDTDGVNQVKIKLVAPVLINLTNLKSHTQCDINELSISQVSWKKVIKEPVLMLQKIYEVYFENA